MATKLLKYGIGVFMPETPEGFDRASLAPTEKVIKVPAGATMRIEEEAEGDRDADIRLVIGEGASVTYVVRGSSKVEFVRRSARLAKGAKLAWIDETSAQDFSRVAYATRLEGEGASVETTSLVRGDGLRRFDAYHEVVHAAPRTTSDLRVGAVLTGRAKAIVRGLVRVEPGATGSVTRQREETLLLSEDAEIDAVPMLEILEPDVRASHAATVGRLDAEKCFYLMSRGLDAASADAMLVDAFVEPYLAKLS